MPFEFRGSWHALVCHHLATNVNPYYLLNPVSVDLENDASRTVGIISFGTRYYGPAQMVGGIERALKGRGYGFALAFIDNLSLRAIRGALRDLERHQVAGSILVTPLLKLRLEDVWALCHSLPFVMIDSRKGARVPSVLFDQAWGSELATRHLLDYGHRDICAISGPLTWSGAFERHQAWLRTLHHAGVTPGPSAEGDWTAEGGYRAAQRLSAHPFTALVVGNDQMALGTVAALRGCGYRVPEDVSVVGFDDVPEARFYSPPLSTVRRDFGVLGQRSAAFILDLIETREESLEQHLLVPELIVRSSSAPLNKR